MTNFHDELKRMAACHDGSDWARDYPTAQAAWDACPRGDWMLWWAARRGVRRRDLVLAACACARLALPYAQGDEAELAIATAEQWAHGDVSVTLDDVRSASAAAADAADAAYFAFAAASAAYAAASAAFAAAYASDAAGTVAVGIPREVTLRKCADICRRFWKEVP